MSGFISFSNNPYAQIINSNIEKSKSSSSETSRFTPTSVAKTINVYKTQSALCKQGVQFKNVK
jgi:hypothetical protein